MQIEVDNRYELRRELRADASLSAPLLHSEIVTGDLVDLIEEGHVSGVLAGRLPLEADRLRAELRPVWLKEPIVDKFELELTASDNGHATTYVCRFDAGRWVRSAQLAALQLREEGTLAEDQVAHRLLIGLKLDHPPALTVPPLQTPPIVAQSLEDFGVRQLGAGNLVPDRPVLVNQRLVADSIQRCLEADTTETGGAVLGKIIRLDQPLPGTETPIVTILSATVDDPRHVGATLSFTFSPEGLADAAKFADLRGLGETVQTVYHTHGWSNKCGNCNQNAACPLAESSPSLQDYQLLESLFSSKATLMPIAGRKLGEPGRRPVLQIHAWRGGQMRPIRFQEYVD